MACSTVLSLNCHGFNAGSVAYLKRVCAEVDIILLQETWLSDINCNKINEALHEFEVFHTSAMETKLSSGFRCGRPFGGTAVLIRKSFTRNSYRVAINNTSLCAVCCQSVYGQSLVFTSIYMPYDDGSRDRVVEYEAVVGSMQGIIDRCLGSKFVFGGDFNVTKCFSNTECASLQNFCLSNKLSWCDNKTSGVNYTFHNDTTNHYSMIDYFICSPEITLPNCDVMILNDGDNISDHFAIECKFGIDKLTEHGYSVTTCKADCGYKLQWEKADILSYQVYLNNQLSRIAIPVDALLCSNVYCRNHCVDLECYYNSIVSCLRTASSNSIPAVKVGLQKPWWTPDLDVLKQQCIDITNTWNSIGRPRSGSINAERLRCKYRYKQAIKDAAFEADQSLNENLFQYLCTKDHDSFWKSWRKRFCSNSVKPTCVLNGKTGDNILPEFTNFYTNVFKPNTVDSNNKFQIELDSLLSTHMHSRTYSVPRIDIADLTTLIGRLKRRKAAGIDDIVSEHILYAGQQLSVHLCILFNALLVHSFVPSDFCKGIIVPLLKSKHGDATQLDMYRGITLSPVLSKLFEMVLLHLFEEFLVSDDLQFGFKKRSGCPHALFAFSESIKYFTSNRNKVYAAFLDASKAFDKVLHNGLFVKLLRKNVPVCLVLLLRGWYSQLQCVVRWQNNYGDSFSVSCGVRQGGVLSPYLFSLYIDDLIDSLRLSGYGLYISQLFIGCLLYADDIVLLSPSCFGLRTFW